MQLLQLAAQSAHAVKHQVSGQSADDLETNFFDVYLQPINKDDAINHNAKFAPASQLAPNDQVDGLDIQADLIPAYEVQDEHEEADGIDTQYEKFPVRAQYSERSSHYPQQPRYQRRDVSGRDPNYREYEEEDQDEGGATFALKANQIEYVDEAPQVAHPSPFARRVSPTTKPSRPVATEKPSPEDMEWRVVRIRRLDRNGRLVPESTRYKKVLWPRGQLFIKDIV